ncbi:CsbD family protein [Leptospira sp. 'Mane']|uniref:CsbD family protein n=1 Tax=Leptospira sp. 'Mane' TaxID=3387407 RepID=UPI00398B3445
MDWNQIEGNWKQVTGQIKEKWGKLTDNDLKEIAGKKDQLLGKIQSYYGNEKGKIEKDLNHFIEGLKIKKT